ncbi:MAG: hypothetical protein ACKOEX_01245 [Planctomycetia bacterium]
MSAAFHHAGLAPGRRGLDGLALERAILAVASAGAGWLAMACGLVLVLRRFAGGVTANPGSSALALICIVGGLLVVVGDLAARAASTRRRFASRVGLVLAVAATALPLPQGDRVGAVMAVTSLAFAGGVLAEPWIRRQRRRPVRVVAPEIAAAPAPPAIAPSPAIAPASAVTPVMPDRLLTGEDGRLVQHLERFLRADGTECVRGRLFLAVPAGVRSASGHVGFCPPFATTPTADVSTAYDEVEAIVVAADILPWGIRVECRLDEPADEAFEIPIDLFASSPPSPAAPPTP